MNSTPERIAEKVETILPGAADLHNTLLPVIRRAYNDGNTTSRDIYDAINSVYIIPQVLTAYVTDIIVGEIWGDDSD